MSNTGHFFLPYLYFNCQYFWPPPLHYGTGIVKWDTVWHLTLKGYEINKTSNSRFWKTAQTHLEASLKIQQLLNYVYYKVSHYIHQICLKYLLCARYCSMLWWIQQTSAFQPCGMYKWWGWRAINNSQWKVIIILDATFTLALPEKGQQKDTWEVREMNSLEWGTNSSHHYNITWSKNVSEQWLNLYSFWNNIHWLQSASCYSISNGCPVYKLPSSQPLPLSCSKLSQHQIISPYSLQNP